MLSVMAPTIESSILTVLTILQKQFKGNKVATYCPRDIVLFVKEAKVLSKKAGFFQDIENVFQSISLRRNANHMQAAKDIMQKTLKDIIPSIGKNPDLAQLTQFSTTCQYKQCKALLNIGLIPVLAQMPRTPGIAKLKTHYLEDDKWNEESYA